jgi:hypothetical protein
MTHNPRYDILFDPSKIGLETAKKLFHQVLHWSGRPCSRATAMSANPPPMTSKLPETGSSYRRNDGDRTSV